MTEGSEEWATLAAARALSAKSRSTLHRWVKAGWVRTMVSRGRVLVRRSDVTETELALFEGREPVIREGNEK